MSDTAIFIAFFVALFVLRVVAATVLFFWILPEGDRCPNCNAVTLRMQARGPIRTLRWLRSSWCLACGWSGLLKRGRLTPQQAPAAELSEKG